MNHIIKFDYDDGVKLKFPVLWCGETYVKEFHFTDANHAALAVDSGLSMCKDCVEAIIKEFSKRV